MGYRVFDHTADLGVEFFGPDQASLFSEAGVALFRIMVAEPPGGGENRQVITVEGVDPEDLLINYLGELLYLFQVREQIVTDVTIDGIDEKRVTASLALTSFDLEKHGLETEIKAATYHQVECGPVEDGWRARVIFDL